MLIAQAIVGFMSDELPLMDNLVTKDLILATQYVILGDFRKFSWNDSSNGCLRFYW